MHGQLVRFTGLAGLALAGASIALNGSVPSNSSSGAQAAAWFDDGPLQHVVAVWMSGVAALALFFYLREINTALSLSDRGLNRAASSLSPVVATLLLIGSAPIMAGAITAHELHRPLPAASAEVFLHLGIGIYLLAVIAFGIYLLLTGLCMLRTHAAPRVLGYCTVLGGAIASAPIFGFLGLVVVLPLWVCIGTAWLLRGNAQQACCSTEASQHT
jgi:hypothetical protein